jgi:hypothetical protein
MNHRIVAGNATVNVKASDIRPATASAATIKTMIASSAENSPLLFLLALQLFTAFAILLLASFLIPINVVPSLK